jgi:hypothetical protein
MQVPWELEGQLPLTPAFSAHLADAARFAVAAVVSNWSPQRSPTALLDALQGAAHLPQLLAALSVNHLPSPEVPSFLVGQAAADGVTFVALRRALTRLVSPVSSR